MAKALSGSKAALKLDGVKIAFVSDISITETNDHLAVDVLDQLTVAEHAPVSHVVSFTCSLFKIDGNSVSQLGIRADNISDILSAPTLTMEVYNRIDDRVEYTISQVVWVGGSGTINARGLWQGNWEFKGVQGSGL